VVQNDSKMNVKLRDFVYLTECVSHDSVVVVIEQLLLFVYFSGGLKLTEVTH